MSRTFLKACTLAAGLGLLMAACRDAPTTVKQAPTPTPRMAVDTPANGTGACMGNDAFASGFTSGMNSATDLNCTANDISIAMAQVTEYSLTSATGPFTPLAAGDTIECTPGQVVYARTDAFLQNNAQSRYDIGVWIATDGGNAVTGTCNQYNLIPNVNGALSLEPSPNGDQCGDMAQGAGLVRVPLDVLSITCPVGVNTVSVGACIGWENSDDTQQRGLCPTTPPGGAAGFRLGTVPETKAKCNCNPFFLPIDVRGTITIVKNVVGGNGPFDFTHDVGSNSDPVVSTPFTILTVGGTGSQLIDKVKAGTYHVTESTPPTGFEFVSASCTTGGSVTGQTATITLSSGGAVTCTFNNRKLPQLKLVKVLAPTSDPGLFDFAIGATSFTNGGTGYGNGGNTGFQVEPVGAITIGESAHSGTTLSNYTSTLACKDAGNNPVTVGSNTGTGGSVTLAAGDAITCTFTNTRNVGTIELKKVWVGTGGQTTLNIGTSAGGSQVKSQLTGAAGAAPLTTGAQTVNTGTYYVSETGGLTDYTSSLACTDNGSPVTPGAGSSVSVATGHTVVCTYTNTRNTGTIELKKVWVGTGGQTTLNIGTSAGGSQVKSQLTGAAGAAPLTTGTQTVETGTFYVSETGGLTDYTSSLACTDNGTPVTPGAGNSLNVAKDHAVICTYTNTRNQGTIELKKVWVGTGGQTTLNIGTSAGGSQTASQLTGAAGAAPLTTGTQTVNTGTYYVSETGGLANYTSALACTDNGSPVTPGVDNSLTVAKDHAVICTFTNTRKTGKLELVKSLVPTGSGLFNLYIKAGSAAGSTVASATDVGDGGTTGAGGTTLETGTYNLSEAAGTGTSLANFTTTGPACVLRGTSTPVTVTTGNVDLGYNQDIVCTITNTEKARLIVSKVAVGSTQSFLFSRTGITNFNLTNGQTNDSGLTLLPGTYTVCELSLPVGWENPTATLNGTPVTLYNPDDPQLLGNFCYNVVLAAGDTKTIEFTNVQPPGGGTRTIGYWKNWSSCSQSNGKQYDKAVAAGNLAATLDGNLSTVSASDPFGLLTSLTCQQAVSILDKRSFDGTKRASDAAYNMAAQLLGARLNYSAGAGQCTAATNAIASGDALLVSIGFNGVGAFLAKGADPTLIAQANTLAGILGSYNEGTLGGGCPTHI